MAPVALPIDPLLPELCETLARSQSLVLEAPPGAGKTTRVPSALLEAGIGGGKEIVVLQPRRLPTRLAAQRVAELARRGVLLPCDVDETILAGGLSTADLPDVDLLVRTSGEVRLSGFLPFEACYAELYFTETLWPDFDEAALDAALADFSRRQRRFGRTAEQTVALG